MHLRKYWFALLLTLNAFLDFAWTETSISKERIKQSACLRNPNLLLCKSLFEEDKREKQANGEAEGALPRQAVGVPAEKIHEESLAPEPRLMAPSDVARLRELCVRFAPLANQFCTNRIVKKELIAKCAGYFKDCAPLMTTTNPLYNIANSFDSKVALNLGSFEVKGIPYYPINEEGTVGATHLLNVPFGSWGGGFSQHVGVRDYWSQYQEAGGNWVDGRYGYKSGWAVPLVQSLGVEGQGGTDVAVPLNSRDFGKIAVNSGYGVGGYYGHNAHTGIDWKKGHVTNQFGVAVPFADTGVNTGTAVAFPSLEAFANLLHPQR